MLNSMLDMAPGGVNIYVKCRVVSNYFGCGNIKNSKPGWNERAKELNARYREAVSHWNIAGHPRSGPLLELKCKA